MITSRSKLEAVVKEFHRRITELHRRRTMPNIKITAEVDGKQVPLETVSTETFEAIKVLEKLKEIPIPVARVGHYKDQPDERRLFLKINQDIKHYIKGENPILAIDLKSGYIAACWQKEVDDSYSGIKNYENIKLL